jgi:HSP20 family protein
VERQHGPILRLTTLIRWDPFREVAAMQNQLSRLLSGTFESAGNGSESWVPTLDASESEDELVYAFDLPGVPQDKVSVEVEDGTLTVSAERERSQESCRSAPTEARAGEAEEDRDRHRRR